MATQSPPKPWERAGATVLPSSSGGLASSMANPSILASQAIASSSSSEAPALPAKPSALNSVVNRTASNYSAYNAAGNRYGASPYGGLSSGVGGYGSYSSPYSRFGGMGSSLYGGMGGYGSMYGGMGGMYGGMGGYGGQPGMMGEDPNSLSNSFNQSTQATFQIIESIVGAFGGFAQMLESTYIATQSSFYAMISVAEQFSNLRDTLGSILGIFAILRWARTLLAKISGRPPPADASALTPAAFARFTGTPLTDAQGRPVPGRPSPSKKPFLFFIMAAFGLPYLMGKLIRALARSQEEAALRQQQLILGPDGRPLPPDQQAQAQAQAQSIDASQLEFCRLLYDYTPEAANGPLTEGIDLAVKKGDPVAVLSKSDPLGNPSEWWRCRTRDGRVGYLPAPYLEAVQRRRPKEIAAGSSTSSSRAQTMTGDERAQTMSTQRTSSLMHEKDLVPAKQAQAPKVEGKIGDVSAESFLKGQFF